MKSKFTFALSLLTLLALLLPANFASAKQGSGKVVPVIVKISLVATPGSINTKGTAKLKIKAAQQEFEVEAQVSKKLVGTVLGVTVGDTVIGTMTVNALGKAKLSLSTEAGQSVPAIAVGTLVGVVNDAGVIILAGQF
ncbi:MAG: hypothetical protein RL616_556 [Verrucomicrobiota bacterium]|jgi:glutamate racemase